MIFNTCFSKQTIDSDSRKSALTFTTVILNDVERNDVIVTNGNTTDAVTSAAEVKVEDESQEKKPEAEETKTADVTSSKTKPLAPFKPDDLSKTPTFSKRSPTTLVRPTSLTSQGTVATLLTSSVTRPTTVASSLDLGFASDLPDSHQIYGTLETLQERCDDDVIETKPDVTSLANADEAKAK